VGVEKITVISDRNGSRSMVISKEEMLAMLILGGLLIMLLLNFCKQAIAQVCAFVSPFSGILSVMIP
jgi:hypothetical protein